MLDHVLNYMIIGFVTTALHILFINTFLDLIVKCKEKTYTCYAIGGAASETIRD